MAEDLTRSTAAPPEAPPEAAEPAAPESRRRKLLVRPMRRDRSEVGNRRFLLAYVALGVILGGAAVSFGMLVMTGANQGGGGGRDDGWSDWKPTATGVAGVEQIASFVSQRYRLPSGKQLVAVVAGKPLVQDEIPVSTVAIEEGTKDSVGDPNYTLHDTGGDFMYVLCGLGQNCAIPEGTASVQRHRLLRREALELALYTFRYADDVDMVVALLPPSPPKARQEQQTAGQLPPFPAMFFRPGDLRGELGVPLESTLPAAPPRPEQIDLKKPEFKRIDALTRGNSFTASFQQGQDASLFLVLDR